MINVALLLLFGFLAVVLAQQEATLVENIVNDFVKPNDGLLSNVVEQFGIVSFSPTPSATASVTTSVSPSASVSPAASAIASSSPLASNSALPSRVSSSTPSSSASPSSSVSPVPSPQGRRPSTPGAPLPPAPLTPPALSVTSSSTPSPSTNPCIEATITLPGSGFENLGFLFQDGEGGQTFDIDSAATFGEAEVGDNCDEDDGEGYLIRSVFGGRETIVLDVKEARDDGFLDNPKELVLRAQLFAGPSIDEAQGEQKISSIAAYTFSGPLSGLSRETTTTIQQISFPTCCTPIGPLGDNECVTNRVATVQISKNADGSVMLSAAQINSQPC